MYFSCIPPEYHRLKSSDDIVDGNVVLLQCTDDTDVRKALGSTPTEHQSHFLGRYGREKQTKKNYKNVVDISHI